MASLGTTIAEWFKKENFGLLLLRIFFGVFLIAYSIFCFMEGGGMLKSLGRAATSLKFPFSPMFWGIVLAFNFIWAGLFVILGFYFRVATFVLFLTGLLSLGQQLSFKVFFLPPFPPSVFLVTLSLALTFVGPGKFSINK